MAILADQPEGQPPGDRPLRKSPAAFRTIAEVAGELELPPHVLRFWESKFPQVKPLKRRGGRRYYRPEDIDLLRQIRTLLYTDGYTIRGVQRLLKDVGARQPAERAAVPALPAAAAGDDEPAFAFALDAAGDDGAGDAGGLADAAAAADFRAADPLAEVLADLQALRALMRRHGF